MVTTDAHIPDGTRIISGDELSGLISMEAVVDALEEAFVAYYEGDAEMPPKSYLNVPDGDFRAMPATVSGSAGIKWVNVHPKNPDRFDIPTVMGVVVYSDPETAYPLAILDGTELTRYRTGAVAGVATKYLAPPDASSLGLLGAGQQAHTQLAAIDSAIDLNRVVVADLDADAIERFIQREGKRDYQIESGSPEDVAGCDVVSTLTPSSEPLLQREWLGDGTHINAMGADAAGKQELDVSILSDSRVVIDDWDQCSHSGEINTAVSNGTFTRDDVAAELSDVVAGCANLDRDQPTVFDSTGLAIQDIATARLFYEAAREADRGTVIDIVGV